MWSIETWEWHSTCGPSVEGIHSGVGTNDPDSAPPPDRTPPQKQAAPVLASSGESRILQQKGPSAKGTKIEAP